MEFNLRQSAKIGSRLLQHAHILYRNRLHHFRDGNMRAEVWAKPMLRQSETMSVFFSRICHCSGTEHRRRTGTTILGGSQIVPQGGQTQKGSGHFEDVTELLVFLGAGVGTTAHALRGSAGPCWGPSDELSPRYCQKAVFLES